MFAVTGHPTLTGTGFHRFGRLLESSELLTDFHLSYSSLDYPDYWKQPLKLLSSPSRLAVSTTGQAFLLSLEHPSKVANVIPILQIRKLRLSWVTLPKII